MGHDLDSAARERLQQYIDIWEGPSTL